MISRPARPRASRLPHRPSTSTPYRLLAAALGIASIGAPGLGCALAVGIEDVSGSPTDDFSQRCVDRTNAFRILHNLGTVERWLEIEQCAEETAEARSRDEPDDAPNGCRPEVCRHHGDSMDEVLTECLSDEDELSEGAESTKLACSSYRKDGQGVVLFFYE